MLGLELYTGMQSIIERCIFSKRGLNIKMIIMQKMSTAYIEKICAIFYKDY